MTSFKRRRISFFARLRNYFITGIVVLIPIGLTLYLTKFTIEVSSDINLSNHHSIHKLRLAIPVSNVEVGLTRL